MSFLDNLYKEIILEHYKRPRNRGRLAGATVSREGVNPSCGDELELFLVLKDGVVADVKFVGEGCAISQASTSMMTEAVKGKTVTEAFALSQDFKAMLHGDGVADTLGDLKTLQGISKLHARVKCAALPWATLEEALARADPSGPQGHLP